MASTVTKERRATANKGHKGQKVAGKGVGVGGGVKLKACKHEGQSCERTCGKNII